MAYRVVPGFVLSKVPNCKHGAITIAPAVSYIGLDIVANTLVSPVLYLSENFFFSRHFL